MGKRNEYRVKTAAVILLVIGIACLVSLSACGPRKVELDPQMQMITTYKFGESREPLTVITDRVRESYGKPDERLKLERQFAQILRSEATYECKDFICRQLRLIGTKESVPVLEKMLIDEKESDMARYALQENTCPEAGKALRNALKKAQGNALIGIINSLGERRDKESVKELEKLKSGQDSGAASAAAAALEKIGAE